MKLKNLFVKSMSLACIGAASLVTSCTDENRLTLEDTQDITEEAVTDSYFQDMDDMAGVAIESADDSEFSGGRVASTKITIADDRFECIGGSVTLVATGNNVTPSGIITVDFGTVGCSDSKGNTRTGILIFTYTGWRFKVGSKVITTTNNYIVNGVKLEGVRTLTNVTGSDSLSPKFNAILAGGKATIDGKSALRESNITWQWKRGVAQDPTDDYLLIDQSSEAHGTTLGGRQYEVTLTKDLIFKRLCGGLPVEGIKKYVIDGDKTVVIDYGDGTCDKKIVVSVNGITRSLTVN